MDLTYRECYPTQFTGPFIEDQALLVGQTGNDIDSKFDQFPCIYPQEYAFEIVDSETGAVIDVPSFITPEGEFILVGTPKTEHIGDYEAKVCSTIYNSLSTTACREFMITVSAIPNNKTVPIEPDFMLKL